MSDTNKSYLKHCRELAQKLAREAKKKEKENSK